MRKHEFTENGEPICDYCLGKGHIERYCPEKRRTSGFSKHKSQQGHFQGKNPKHYVVSVVYAIDDCAEVPMVINVGVYGEHINGMLDSGAMENVIDIKTLERMNPHVRVERFRKRLIGADKKHIRVRGTAFIPVRIGKKKRKLRGVLKLKILTRN